MRRVLIGSFAMFAFVGFASAEDKPAALVGTWTREANGLDLKVEFSGKDVVKISAIADGNGVTVTSKYAIKDGVVKATITKVDVKGDFNNAPKVGLEFTFKWKVKGDTGTMDDFEGTGLDHAKPVLEGEYAKQKKKSKD